MRGKETAGVDGKGYGWLLFYNFIY